MYLPGRFFALALCAWALAGCFNANKPAHESVGKRVGQLSFQSLDGEVKSLESFVKADKPTVLNIWATWCTPCVKELPSFLKLQQQGEFNVLAVSTDRDVAQIKKFLAKNNLGGLHVAHDPLGRLSRTEPLKAMQLPQTFILDQGLTIRAVEAGERVWHHPDMVAKIKAALKGAK